VEGDQTRSWSEFEISPGLPAPSTRATSSAGFRAVPRTQYPRQVVIADFNGDHRPDVFIADHGDDHSPFPGYQNTLILSAPGGKLVDATANLPQAYDFTHSAAAADINGDGTTDLYVGNIYGANAVPPEILLNDGRGHFTVGNGLLPPSVTNVFTTQFTGSNFVDVNGDGHPDLVLSGGSSQSKVLLNDGTGHFSELPGALPAKPFAPDAIGFDPTPLDINGDGHSDLLIGYTKGKPSYVGRWIQVLINNRNGTFRDETASRLPQSDNSSTWPEFFKLRDLQRNGRSDFGVETNSLSGGPPLLYLSDQHGDFRPGPTLDAGFITWAFIGASGDGSNDIVGVTSLGDVVLLPELPTLSRLKLKPAAFRAARSGASIALAGTGTEVSYGDSVASRTRFTVDRALLGFERGHRCVYSSHRANDSQRCTRFVALAGGFTRTDSVGTNRFRFTGRIGGRALGPAAYRLDATPRNTSGVGPTIHVSFRIIG
jgi:FG-GAP-like repeat